MSDVALLLMFPFDPVFGVPCPLYAVISSIYFPLFCFPLLRLHFLSCHSVNLSVHLFSSILLRWPAHLHKNNPSVVWRLCNSVSKWDVLAVWFTLPSVLHYNFVPFCLVVVLVFAPLIVSIHCLQTFRLLFAVSYHKGYLYLLSTFNPNLPMLIQNENPCLYFKQCFLCLNSNYKNNFLSQWNTLD